MKAKATVLIKNDQKKIKMTPDLRRLVKRAVLAVLDFEDFGRRAEVSVTFTDNEGIHALNREYRNVDRPTDVLSFPLSDGEDYDTDGDAVLLGDIVISLERAQTQAEEYGHSFEREVAFLTVHSMLHLLGYDHETSPEDERDMFARQDEILISAGMTR
ncbi:MAG: rRNA maturation RNase YbeY [Eubacteriales bacterium]|uniref:Endoribonuclease YbeY n=3 Tax=Candidatus Colimorpha enterica TaxID=3083063 RepID=R6U001_9BACT|nr:rRNA maturation RNase YbeY [Candidatus Colimorpha enterica]CDC73446.1 probable rRNA maturation factor [Candidatus Colimorpha enterica]